VRGVTSVMVLVPRNIVHEAPGLAIVNGVGLARRGSLVEEKCRHAGSGNSGCYFVDITLQGLNVLKDSRIDLLEHIAWSAVDADKEGVVDESVAERSHLGRTIDTEIGKDGFEISYIHG